ncbi:MAG: cache domain-containing protein, partial [Pseudomonadota bacterium]
MNPEPNDPQGTGSREDAPHPEQDRRQRPDHRLTRRYRWLLFAITLPLFLVVLTLATTQYRDQRTQLLDELARSLDNHAISLDSLAQQAGDHVQRMKSWYESVPHAPSDEVRALRQYLRPRLSSSGAPDGWSLDALPASLRKRNGQVLMPSTHPRMPLDQADQALAFFSLLSLSHEIAPHFEWSYTIRADNAYHAIYPWIDSRHFIEGQGLPNLVQGAHSFFTYEVYTAGLPSKNPEGRAYWTRPYNDASGMGAMVSHGAPVYRSGRFTGIVGTDLRLAVLEDQLRSLPRTAGDFWILGKDGEILGTTWGPANPILRNLDDIPAGQLTRSEYAAATASPTRILETDQHILIEHTLNHAPWTLLHVVDQKEIAALLLPRFVPYGVILAVLAGTFLLALFLLRREFINPAFELVHYIQRVSRDPAAAEPSVPRLWQTWVTVVSRTFAANREASRKLKENEAFKTAIVDNALLAVITMDAEGRVVEFNPAA